MVAKASGETKEITSSLFDKFINEFGKHEIEIEQYFDMTKISPYIENLDSPTSETILVED